MGYSRGSLILLVLIVLITSGCIASSLHPVDTTIPISAATRTPDQNLSPVTVVAIVIPSQYAGIKFEGDVDINCSLQTVHSLELLETKALEDFLTVRKYIGIIECRDVWSAMYAWENPPRFAVGKATRDSGTIWYAGSIAHDSCHSRQYDDYAKVHPGVTVPPELFSGEAAEKECIRYQYGVLEKIGAPKKMLDYVANSSSTRYRDTRNAWW